MFFQRTAIKSHIQQDIHMYFFLEWTDNYGNRKKGADKWRNAVASTLSNSGR